MRDNWTDYCGLGQTQKLQIFKTPCSWSWTGVLRIADVMQGLERAWFRHANVISEYMVNGAPFAGMVHPEGATFGDEMPIRVMAGVKHFGLVNRAIQPLIETPGLLYLRTRFFRVMGPSMGIIWTDDKDDDGEPIKVPDPRSMDVYLLSEVGLGFPELDGREWKSNNMNDAWEAEKKKFEMRLEAYLGGLAAGKEMAGDSVYGD